MRKKHDVASKAVFVLLTLFASSCTNETMPGGDAPLPTGKYPLEFTSQMYVTRATSADNWDGGEQIALKIGTDVKTYVVSDKTTGAITSTAPFYWTNTGETKTVSAYYPYALATATTLTIKENQSTAVNYQASDALYAPATTFAFTDATKQLTFRHLPARVCVNLKAGDGVTAAEAQGATVKFVNQSRTAPFNNSTGVVTPAAGSATVIPNAIATASDYQKSVQALLVPCQMKDKQFIAVTLGSDTFYYTPTTTTDGNLESGKGYIYAITVKRDGIEVKLKESGEWGSGGSEDVQSLPLMAFTIDLTLYPSDMTYTLPFKTSPSDRTTCEMTVDWGDGEITPFSSGTSLAINSTAFTHTYTEAKEYTITIITAQADFSREQIPGFSPGIYRPTNNNVKKLKSLLTPLLNTWESRFNRCFYYCSNLSGSIPKDLFVNNKQVTDFGGCFTECSELSGEIPAGLFATNPLVTTFQQCFDGCTKLTMNANIFCNETNGEGATRFLNKSVSFLYCFRNVGSDASVSNAGTAPALWDYSYGTGAPTKVRCFIGIGTVTNATAIPTEWKQ